MNKKCFDLLTLSITFYFVKSYTCGAFLFDLVFSYSKSDQFYERNWVSWYIFSKILTISFDKHHFEWVKTRPWIRYFKHGDFILNLYVISISISILTYAAPSSFLFENKLNTTGRGAAGVRIERVTEAIIYPKNSFQLLTLFNSFCHSPSVLIITVFSLKFWFTIG